MSDQDKFTNQNAIDIQVAIGSVDGEAHDRGNFPFDAFSFNDPKSSSTPVLSLASPWQLEVVSNLAVGGNAAITGTTTITGAATLQSTLNVAGTATITGGVTGDLTGTASFATSANVTTYIDDQGGGSDLKVKVVGGSTVGTTFLSIPHGLTQSTIMGASPAYLGSTGGVDWIRVDASAVDIVLGTASSGVRVNVTLFYTG
jgi:hypothetical protein